MLTGTVRRNFQNLRYFSVSGLKDWKVAKSKPTRKLKHAEYFEYFCQMSSKSILTILSYTVSNLARFFWDTVYFTNSHGTKHAQYLFGICSWTEGIVRQKIGVIRQHRSFSSCQWTTRRTSVSALYTSRSKDRISRLLRRERSVFWSLWDPRWLLSLLMLSWLLNGPLWLDFDLGLLSVPRHNISFGSPAVRISHFLFQLPKYGIPYRLTFCSLKHFWRPPTFSQPTLIGVTYGGYEGYAYPPLFGEGGTVPPTFWAYDRKNASDFPSSSDHVSPYNI